MYQKRFKKFLGPSYRRYVRPVIRNLTTVPNSKIRNIQADDSENIRLIGFLQIYNESEKGNLERVLKHLSKFCDDIVIYDNGSTDNSREIASKYTKHIIGPKVNDDFRNELKHKQELLELALSLNPDWIVWLDADEVFDRDGENFGIRALCKYGQTKGIDGFLFQEFNLWKNENQYRVDENWHTNWQPRLWKNNGKLAFKVKYGLHHSTFLHLKKIRPSEIKVIHYAFSTTEKINEKYQMYKEFGQTGWNLERIRNEDGISLKPFSKDWFPLSSLKIVIVCLIYQSTKYLEFVLNSFNKHTPDTKLLFVANDATSEVKKYLVENGIDHLIYENEDKDEYYIKRVYRAWNFGGNNADGDIIVFVNSDMAFSNNWLENLLKNLSEKRIVTSRLVESGKLGSPKIAISKDFGKSYNKFDESGFEKFAESIKEDKIVEGGLFMPCAIYKNIFVKSGGYPIGNRTEKSGKIISGDWIYFYEKLKPMGIKHVTVCDSIVYHIQEGEMDD